MLSLYRFDKSRQAGHWSASESVQLKLDQLLHGGEVMWLDLEDPTEAEEQFAFEKIFKVHPLSLEDVARLRREPDSPPHFPKAEEFPDYLFVIVNPLMPGFRAALEGGEADQDSVRPATQLSAILTKNLLITHHYQPVASVSELRNFLTRHEGLSERGPDYLFHLILDGMVDEYAAVLDHFDDRLDAMESEVLEKPSRGLLVRLLGLKRHITQIRKILVYQREVVARLIRGEFSLIEERELVYYRNVYDHLVRFAELCDSSRDLAADLLQTHLSAASNKLNEVMKVLTMISTIVLPMTLIAGIYGMNFEQMPEIKTSWGYPFALGLMALAGITSFTFFRWRKWI